jgi:hypothetical protein
LTYQHGMGLGFEVIGLDATETPAVLVPVSS